MDLLEKCLKFYPDFPKKGVNFVDIFPLFNSDKTIGKMCELFSARYTNDFHDTDITKVVAVESRGFLFAPIICGSYEIPLVPARKPGKLPGQVVSTSFKTEYEEDTLEIQKDAIRQGDIVLIHDDVLATGRTMYNLAQLCKTLGAKRVYCNAIVELDYLKPREILDNVDDIYSFIHLK